MGESNKEIIEKINRYQESLERYNKKGDDHKMIHYLKKLRDLPINISHLEETGVGRSVNALRKLDGSVGDAARDLVCKWKEMVMEADNSSPEKEIPEEKHKSSSKYHSHNSKKRDNSYQSDDQGSANEEDEKSLSEGYESNGSDSDAQNGSPERNEKNYDSRNERSYDSDSRDAGRDRSESRKHESSSKHKERKRHRESDEEDDSEPEVKHFKKEHSKEKSKHSKSSSSDKHSSDDRESSKHRDKSKDKHHHKSSKEKKDKHSDHSKDKSKTDSKSHKRHRESSPEDNSHSKHKKESSHHKHSDREESSKSKHKKSEPSTSEKKETSKHENRSKDNKEKPSSDSKHSSDSAKDASKDHKKKESSKHEQEKHKSKSESKEKSEHKSSKKDKDTSSSSSSSKHKDKDKTKSPSKNKETKPAPKIKLVDSIDSGSGASFAEALGMCAPIKPKTSKKKVSSNSGSSSSKPSSSSKENESEDNLPPLLKEPVHMEPLDLNISNLLPPITPNYRPIGNATLENFQKKLTEEEALSRVIYAKNQRTKVYSGNKTAWGIVPSLFDLCTRVLQDNIDALEYTGGVPYHILKPILEKANPDQLYMLEHHNPYIIDDSDELWQLHCMKDFRNKKREELESWRDMYMRCLDEREAKLKALTANIKQAQDKSLPVRTTKLAYVDDYVKPPRNVLRQQAKHGTAHEKRPVVTPAAKTTAVANAVAAATDKVPNPGARAAERSSQATMKVKPKKAPLMAKTLSFLKNRFKR